MPLTPHQAAVRVALSLTVLLSLPLSFTEFRKTLHAGPGDFHVYLNAAHMVRQHESQHLYDGADTGQDPQLRPAVVGSRYYQIAEEHGIHQIGLYVYPPALADALVPLTYVSIAHADEAWVAVDLLCLAGTAILLAWWMELPLVSPGAFGILSALLVFRTDITAIYWGQVTLVLLLLWTAGIVLFERGQTAASAGVMALATAFKLTPVLILLPMLFWRQWRWVRWYFLVLGCLTAIVLWINGLAPLADYVLRVMPPMSAGIPGILNTSLSSGLQMLWAAMHGVDVKNTFFIPQSHRAVLAAKLISLTVLGAVCVALLRNGLPVRIWNRTKTLALVAVLSVCLSPVAWRHGYTLALPLLFVLWREAFQHTPTRLRLVALGLLTLEFAFVFDSLIAKATRGVAFAAVPLLAPLCVLLVCWFEFQRIHAEQQEASN